MIQELYFKVERWGKQWPDELRVTVYGREPSWAAFAGRGDVRMLGEFRAEMPALAGLRGLLDEALQHFPGFEVYWSGEPVVPAPPSGMVKRLMPILNLVRKKLL